MSETNQATLYPIETLTKPVEAQLVDMKMPRGSWKPMHLESIRDEYQRLKTRLEPHDLERPGNQFRFLMPNGHPPSLQVISPTGLQEQYALTKTALSQFATAIFSGGKKFYDGLCALAVMPDSKGSYGLHHQLAKAVANEFLVQDSKPRLVRTFGSFPKMGPVVRAFLSQSYSVINDTDLVQALLDNPRTANLPVLDVKSTDAGTRIRLALDSSVSFNTQPELRRPIELLEVWNSEVGRRGVWAVQGIWKLICTNGLTGFDAKLRYMWRHKGSRDRILSGLGEFVEASKTKVSGVLEAYHHASQVHIQHLLSFIQGLGQPAMPEDVRLSKEQVARVTGALGDPVVANNGSNYLGLSSVVDAMTFAAQGEKDVFEAERMEHAAGYVLKRGIEAEHQGIIRVTFEKEQPIVHW